MPAHNANFFPKRFHEKDNVTNWHFLSTTKSDDTGRDLFSYADENYGMSKGKKKQLTGYEKEVIRRTREARNSLDINQDAMSDLLGIVRATYAKYETDRIMDIELIPKFCILSGVSIEYLLTGKEHPLIEAYRAASTDDKRLAEKVLGTTAIEPLKKSHVA